MNAQTVFQTGAICLAVFALAFWAIWGCFYLRDTYKYRFKRHQIDKRKAVEDDKRYKAVQDLVALIPQRVERLCGTSAMHSLARLSEVEYAANKVFEQWKELNAGYFPVVDGRIKITGVKNGSFTYKLPPQLEKLRKRR